MQNPEIYRISAPILHMDKLVRPLLVLHGTNDRNVSFEDSLRLFDVLIKLGKPFESQIYPGEIHFFRRNIVLKDAWRRIEEFFDRHLKAAPRRHQITLSSRPASSIVLGATIRNQGNSARLAPVLRRMRRLPRSSARQLIGSSGVMKRRADESAIMRAISSANTRQRYGTGLQRGGNSIGRQHPCAG